MLEDLAKASNKTVGIKQTLKAVRDGKAKTVFLARDVDDYLFRKVNSECEKYRMPIVYVDSMKELGEACCIDVGAATAAILN